MIGNSHQDGDENNNEKNNEDVLRNPNNVVVSSLPNAGPHPYTSIALSPNRDLAIIAGKDSLRVVSISSQDGLRELQSYSVSQYFQAGPPSASIVNNNRINNNDKNSGRSYTDVRDTFELPRSSQPNTAAATNSNVGANSNITITHVAWSNHHQINNKFNNTSSWSESHYLNYFNSGREYEFNSSINNNEDKGIAEEELLAAAGSNGVVVVWRVSNFLSGKAPEAVLMAHSRAIHKMAWHPFSDFLLTASQDSTVKLWYRQSTTTSKSVPTPNHKQVPSTAGGGIRSWLSGLTPSAENSSQLHPNQNHQHNNNNWNKSFTWKCHSTFQPKSEPVRDIQWNSFHGNFFGLVTDGGYLIVYNFRLPTRPIVRIAAHSGDATTIDWHPTRPFFVATGGGRDCCVKVWNLEDDLSIANVHQSDTIAQNMKVNSNSVRSEGDSSDLTNDISNYIDDQTPCMSSSYGSSSTIRRSHTQYATIGAYSNNQGGSGISPSSLLKRSVSFLQTTGATTTHQTRSYHHKGSQSLSIHTLSGTAPICKVKWRPSSSTELNQNIHNNRHDAMLAVATAPAGGANAWGQGTVDLWSYHRPFMPLSVVKGHLEGAVTDFVWFDTPPIHRTQNNSNNNESTTRDEINDLQQYQPVYSSISNETSNVRMNTSSLSGRHELEDINGQTVDMTVTNGTWQHILSVGKDGRCLLQSLARGERPISQVTPSAFAIANLSPFQSGFGSLQIMSVHQKVPYGNNNDFALTGLRRDVGTAMVSGVFKEDPPLKDKKNNNFKWKSNEPKQTSFKIPDLNFFATDSGDLDQASNLPTSAPQNDLAVICPEVMHLSRFAESYRLMTDEEFPTKAAVCMYNGKVAENLNFHAHARMWLNLASILKSCDEPFDLSTIHNDKLVMPMNPMAFIIQPTLKSLLLERADAGDVQTCVTLCEVMGVIPLQPKSNTSSQMSPVTQTALPGLDINLVREWYLSYIDLLQQMCLFSHATHLIRSCNDPEIATMNQQATRFHESCPSCGKFLPGVTISREVDQRSNETVTVTTQRACGSCRKRIGFCFICHEPVKGVFVWCPGCGHGGHLDHALEWFGSGNQFCPTGCVLIFKFHLIIRT